MPWLWSNALNNRAKYVKGLFNAPRWWSKSIKFIQPWRRLWLSYTSAVLLCVDHEEKNNRKWNVISSWWAEMPLMHLTWREFILRAAIKIFFPYLSRNTMNQCLQSVITFLSISEWKHMGCCNHCDFIVCSVKWDVLWAPEPCKYPHIYFGKQKFSVISWCFIYLFIFLSIDLIAQIWKTDKATRY